MNEHIEFLNKNIAVFNGLEKIELGKNHNNIEYVDFYLTNLDIRYEFTLESLSRQILSVKLDENLTEYKINIPGLGDNLNFQGNDYLPYLYFECKEGSLIFRISDSNAHENKLMTNFSLYLRQGIPEDLLIRLIYSFNMIFGDFCGGVQIFEKDFEYFQNLKKYFK